MRKALDSTGIAIDKRVRDAAVELWVEDVGCVESSAGRCLDFEVIRRIVQTACSDEYLHHLLQKHTLRSWAAADRQVA